FCPGACRSDPRRKKTSAMMPRVQRPRGSDPRVSSGGRFVPPSKPGARGRSVKARLKRLALFACLGAVVLYVSGALAGFLWMRYGRKNEQITFLQVAFLRWRAVRRGLAAKQLVEAKAQAEAKSYQSAYLLYSSAVRNDPDNIPARLAAGQFFVS